MAAINGAALGGGLEIALACHHRIAYDDPRTELGLPEVTLGLLPGGGGVTRVVRMLGLTDGLMGVLLTGTRFKPAAALEKGLVDELVADRDELVPAAKAWILAHRDDEEAAVQPWDRAGYRMPGGTPSQPQAGGVPAGVPGQPAQADQGRGLPGAAGDPVRRGRGRAGRLRDREPDRVALPHQADRRAERQEHDPGVLLRPAGDQLRASCVPRASRSSRATRLGVLGAGMMGAGIAYSAARSGIEVVLKDVSLEAAEKGKAYSATILDKAISRGKMTEEKKAEILARITPTADPADLAGCDSVIEAVFEDPALKARVYGEVQDVVNPDALLASNTSTLPITELSGAVDRPEDFIGMHFFSPVDKMPLVEIIRGAKTSDETVARAIDVVQQIKKTPIVVNDSRGFYTSRVYGTLLTEAAALLDEGVDPQTIERAATMAGFPAPPLAMLDEVSLTLTQSIRKATVEAAARDGVDLPEQPGTATIDRMVDEFGRKGKAAGAGFYDYPRGREEEALARAARALHPRRRRRSRWSTSRSGTCSGWRWRPLPASTRASSSPPPPRTSARSWASASRRSTAARCSTCRATRAAPAPG